MIVIDGEIVDLTTQDCPAGNCAASLNYTFDTTAHPGGEHRVDIRAVDELGHESARSFAFSTACCLGGVRSWGAAPGLVDVAFGDVNADGLADLVTRDPLTSELKVGLSDGASFGTAVSWGVWARPGSLGRMQLSDVDGDGLDDVVVRDAPSDAVYVARSLGTAFAAPALWGSVAAGEEFAAADVNGDFSSDVVGRDPVTGAVRVGESAFFDGEGEARFDAPSVWSAAAGPGFLVGDADGDGTGDLIARDGSGGVRVKLSSTLDFTGDDVWGALASDHALSAGDVNGDGTADAVGRSPSTGEVLFAASTTTAFEAAERVGSFPTRYSLDLADVNGDRREDLVGRDSLTGDVAVALSGAPGNFGPDAEDWVPDPDIPYDETDLFSDGARKDMQLGFEDPARLLYRSRLLIGGDPFGDGERAANERLDLIYSRIRAAGARMVRFNVYWGTHQDANGNFDFERLGKAVDRALANRMKVHVTLGGNTKNECIGAGEDPANTLYNRNARACEDDPNHDVCGAPVDPTNPERQKRPTGIAPDPVCYARFVRAAVNSLGERVNAYSLWNEPNVRGFLRPPDALDDRRVVPANLYRSLYVHGWDAIRGSNNPDAKVMIGELELSARAGSLYRWRPQGARRCDRPRVPGAGRPAGC